MHIFKENKSSFCCGYVYGICVCVFTAPKSTSFVKMKCEYDAEKIENVHMNLFLLVKK